MAPLGGTHRPEQQHTTGAIAERHYAPPVRSLGRHAPDDRIAAQHRCLGQSRAFRIGELRCRPCAFSRPGGAEGIEGASDATPDGTALGFPLWRSEMSANSPTHQLDHEESDEIREWNND